MCGRFTLTADPADLQEVFYWVNFGNADIPPRYNIAPTQSVPVITNSGENKLDFFTWGLVPFWAKDPAIGRRMINARSETIAEKPSFRNAYKRRRCLILADGFFEWKKNSNSSTKTPFYIQMKDEKPFAFAGIWENWFSQDGSQILSTTIITTKPNPLIAPIHNRMPVILHPDSYNIWLLPGEAKAEDLNSVLVPADSTLMKVYPVSRKVNNPRIDSPDCIEPLSST